MPNFAQLLQCAKRITIDYFPISQHYWNWRYWQDIPGFERWGFTIYSQCIWTLEVFGFLIQ